MVRLITISILFAMAFLSLAFFKKETLELSRVKACFQEQKEKCGDLICEMSTDDISLVIEQLESNIIDCLQQQP